MQHDRAKDRISELIEKMDVAKLDRMLEILHSACSESDDIDRQM